MISKTVSVQDMVPAMMQVINSGGMVTLTVTGRSMRPLLLDRISRVTLGAPLDIKAGDMVLYRRSNGTLVLHRVVKRLPDASLVLCGDAQHSCEYGITQAQLLAKVSCFYRRRRKTSCEGIFSPGDAAYRIWWHIHLADLPLRHLLSGAFGKTGRLISRLSQALKGIHK